MIAYPIYKTKKNHCLIVEWDGMISRYYMKDKKRLERFLEWIKGFEGYCIVCEWPKGQKTQILKNIASKTKLRSIYL